MDQYTHEVCAEYWKKIIQAWETANCERKLITERIENGQMGADPIAMKY